MSPMSRLSLSLLCSAALAVAAPVAEPKGTPITAKNAHEVRPLREVKKLANQIVRGPKRELILLDWGTAAEVIDDVKLQTIRVVAKGHKPISIAVSPDGKHLTWVGRGQKRYTIQETASGKTIEIEIGDNPGAAAFSPDGKQVAIGSTFWDPNVEGAGHSEMRMFDTKGKEVRSLGKTSRPGALRPVFSPDGKVLAVGNRNYETQLFDAATGKLLHRLGKWSSQEVAFSPNGKTLAVGYVDGTVGLWNVATGKLLHSAPSGCKEVYSVDWSPKGDVLATSGREGKIVLWEPGKLTRLKELDAPFWVIQVRFTADGGRLLTSSATDYGSKDRKITVWTAQPSPEPKAP